MKSLLSIIVALAFASSPLHAEFLSLEPIHAPSEPRNAVWKPLASFVLPGFGQYFERQWVSGATYSTVAIGGLSMAAAAAAEISKSDLQDKDLQDQNDLQRQYTYGMQLYMFSGEISAYHAFRTAVLTRKPLGDYAFIRDKEDTLDIMASPFELEHLIRPTTYIPLLVLAAVGFSTVHKDGFLDFGDAAFTGGVSYNAGVGEEAMFRGYFMPVLHQAFGGPFWANATQSVVFGAAHYSSYNQFPIAQTAMGFYLGWLTQRNGYSIRQSAFLHTWWDVLAIGFQIADQNGKNAVARPIPLLNFTF